MVPKISLVFVFVLLKILNVVSANCQCVSNEELFCRSSTTRIERNECDAEVVFIFFSGLMRGKNKFDRNRFPKLKQIHLTRPNIISEKEKLWLLEVCGQAVAVFDFMGKNLCKGEKMGTSEEKEKINGFGNWEEEKNKEQDESGPRIRSFDDDATTKFFQQPNATSAAAASKEESQRDESTKVFLVCVISIVLTIFTFVTSILVCVKKQLWRKIKKLSLRCRLIPETELGLSWQYYSQSSDSTQPPDPFKIHHLMTPEDCSTPKFPSPSAPNESGITVASPVQDDRNGTTSPPPPASLPKRKPVPPPPYLLQRIASYNISPPSRPPRRSSRIESRRGKDDK